MLTEEIPKIMLVDMNSFFASVEQQANPKYRGKPLGVCASLHPTSCIIAASKEAKALGIRTGTLIYKARKICPDIILAESEPEKYREVNRRINRIFADYTDRVESYSIDESFLDLEDAACNPLAIGAEIKQRIRDEVGEWLTCSVGIGSNKFMAKLAADMKKPDGLSVVWRSGLDEIYRNLEFTDLWGVARGWQKRLMSLGMTGPRDVLSYPVANLLAVFGKPGFYIWQRINGLEQDLIPISNVDYLNPKQYLKLENDQNSLEDSNFDDLNLFRASDLGFRNSDAPKSFGHSWVLNFRTTDKDRLKAVVMRLAEKAARRMREQGFKASGMYFGITDVAGGCVHKSKKLKRTINTGQELYDEALNLWANWEFRHDIMHIAVGFTNLLSDCLQLDLFGGHNSDLIKTLDNINDRYGEFTVRSGLLTETSGYAPDAIAFGK
ncbi:MAG: DNA polymerase IV [Candidatus Doudnabacteria bacterium]|nr:DNA polymerase IV [Candidatus Doudnabacteria bacterium]